MDLISESVADNCIEKLSCGGLFIQASFMINMRLAGMDTGGPAAPIRLLINEPSFMFQQVWHMAFFSARL